MNYISSAGVLKLKDDDILGQFRQSTRRTWQDVSPQDEFTHSYPTPPALIY